MHYIYPIVLINYFYRHHPPFIGLFMAKNLGRRGYIKHGHKTTFAVMVAAGQALARKTHRKTFRKTLMVLG